MKSWKFLNTAAPFNLFGWSLAIILLFILLQVVVTVAYAMWGYAVSPFVGVFTWFVVSAALGFSIFKKYKPKRGHMLALQGLACFYMFAISIALTLRADSGLQLNGALRGIGVTLLLYAVGLVAFYFSFLLLQRRLSA